MTTYRSNVYILQYTVLFLSYLCSILLKSLAYIDMYKKCKKIVVFLLYFAYFWVNDTPLNIIQRGIFPHFRRFLILHYQTFSPVCYMSCGISEILLGERENQRRDLHLHLVSLTQSFNGRH